MSSMTQSRSNALRARQNDGDVNLGRPTPPSFSTSSAKKVSKTSVAIKANLAATTPPPQLELSEDVNKIYLEYLSAEKYIRNFLTERDFYQLVGDRKKLTRAISALHLSSSELLSTSLTAFTRLSIDHRLWKVSVYQIVTAGRAASAGNPSRKADIQKVVTFFLEKGLKHLEELRDGIIAKCPLTRNPFHGGAEYASSTEAEAAKVSHPRILLSIGDTHRYGNALKLALEAYEEARSIDPGNGTAYHQMGLMALIQRDFLSASYDFLRSATSPAPVEGARQQLQIAFDESFKSYTKASSSYWFQAVKKGEKRSHETVAKEIWLFAQKSRLLNVPSSANELDTKESHCRKFSSQELSQRFCLTFVVVIGKLWTNVGFETVNDVAEESLVYLEALLERRSNFLPLRILQVESLLIMLLDELRCKGTSSPVWLTAIQYALEICIVLSERLEKLIDLCDWDSPQMETVAIGLSTWVTWMESHPKDWTARRPRPVFCLKHSMRLKEDVVEDRLDHTWQVFASLMTKLTVVFRRYATSLFPSVLISNDDGKHKVLLSPFPEAKHLFGLSSISNSYIFHHKHFCDNRHRAQRGRNYIRLNSIFRFGLLFLHEKYKILEIRGENGLEEFFSRVKVKRPYSEGEICGLDSNHQLYWTTHSESNSNNNRSNTPSTNVSDSLKRRGNANNAGRTILKSTKANISAAATPATTETETTSASSMKPGVSKKAKAHKHTFSAWENFTKEGFRTDIVIEPQNFVLDTNCFVRRLHMIKVLICVSLRPLFIPVSVILELKGLSKGGLRKKDQVRYGSDMRNAQAQQKLVDGMELGERCLEALTFIADNMAYFQVVTSTGSVLKIKTPHAFVKDDHFDPSDNNDDRILQSCRKLEELDFCLRDRDTTRRIYRKTVLLTADRCLRLKSNLQYYIPARSITPVVVWLISQCSIKFYGRVTRALSEIREKRTLKRKEKREKTRALKKASSPLPLPDQPKVTSILQHPIFLKD